MQIMAVRIGVKFLICVPCDLLW